MFKIEFNPGLYPDDMKQCGALMERIGRALQLGSVSIVATPPPEPARRGRPPKASVDPVAAYVEAGGKMPAPADEIPASWGVESDPAPIQYDLASAPSPVTTLAEEVTAAEAAPLLLDLDGLRIQLRAAAQEKGALWLRPWLLQDKASKVSELTEATMRAALESVA